MRIFEGADGRSWEVVAGRESWGACYAIFLPREGGGTVLQAMLRSSSMQDALSELSALDDAGLAALLEGATVKPME